MSRSSRTIYVGNLPGDIRESEIEDLFYKYGRIVDIDLKLPPRPPGYCFIEFEDPRDAEDAIRGRDGYSFDGNRLRVEFAHSGRGPPAYERFSSHRSSGGGRGASRRSEYRVIVTGLPSSASWQDLKDHMRTAGEVCFAQVFRESNATRGIVDFTNYDDMKNAIRKLDDTEFRNPFAHSYIRVREDKSSKKSASRSRSRSRSWRSRSHSNSRSVSRSRSPARRSRSRSRSRSPVRESRSRSRSRSPVRHSKSKSASRSPSRSRSKSPPAKQISRSRSRSRSASPQDAENGRATSASPRPSRSPSPKPDDRDKSPAARSPSPVSDGP